MFTKISEHVRAPVSKDRKKKRAWKNLQYWPKVRKVTKRLNCNWLSKTKSVWNMTWWVLLFKENLYKTISVKFYQFNHMLLLVFKSFFFKFVTLCNEKMMSNFKRTKQSKQSLYIFYQQRTSILTSFDAVLFSIIVLKIAPSVLLLKLSVHWNCSWVYCGSEKAMQNQFTRHKLALHLILIKKWNGIHFFFLKHSELFLGVPE